MRIGCDLVEIARIEESIKKPQFIDRVFHELEVTYCEQRVKREACYAARFAAKEAFVKALGTGLFVQGVTLKDVWVENEESGRPMLRFSAKASELLLQAGLANCDVSLSHQDEYAMAVVLLY